MGAGSTSSLQDLTFLGRKTEAVKIEWSKQEEKTMRMTQKLALTATLATLMASSALADTTLSVLLDTNPKASCPSRPSWLPTRKSGLISHLTSKTARGSEGDNIVKTRLATGEMADIFQYNSGSLFLALKPEQTLADLSDLLVTKTSLTAIGQW